MRYTTILYIFGLLLCATTAYCQTPNYDQLITPADQSPRTFEEYLVQLAWNNSPVSTKLTSRVNLAKGKQRAVKNEWTSGLSANFGVSPRDTNTIRDYDLLPDGTVIRPGYNFGVSLSLGPLFTQKGKNMAAKEEVKIAEADINIEKVELRAKVLTSYRRYTLAFEILKARLQALESASANKTFITERFNSNKAEYDDLSRAETTYYRALEEKIMAENEIQFRKIELEELIGVKYETAERYKAKLLQQ